MHICPCQNMLLLKHHCCKTLPCLIPHQYMATPNISSMYLIATSKTPKVISLRYIRLANTRIRAAPGDILLNMNTLALLSSDNPPETWSSTSACECSGKKRTEYTPNVDFLPPKCIQYKPVKSSSSISLSSVKFLALNSIPFIRSRLGIMRLEDRIKAC